MRKSLFGFSIFLLVVSGLLTFENLFIIDFSVVQTDQLPTPAIWDKHFESLDPDICDGERDSQYLNESFLGGWNKCITLFAHNLEPLPWDFFVASKESPFELWRNLSCTDNIAGQLGWRKATEKIHAVLKTTNEDDLRNQIYRTNDRVLWCTTIGAVFLCLCVAADVYGCRNRTQNKR
jgi:hypothetical protein